MADVATEKDHRTMSLIGLLSEACAASSGKNLYPEPFHTGFYDVETEEQVTVVAAETHLYTEDGLTQAEFVYYVTHAQLEALLNPQHPDRQQLVLERQAVPGSLLATLRLVDLLRWLDVPLEPALDLPAFGGPFRMPLRYPVPQNPYLRMTYEPEPIPVYDRSQLPQLIADDHPTWVTMYDKAWELAFEHLRQPEPESGFVSNFIDTAFNTNTFMWDSCFMMMFGRYGNQVFDFMGTLDNFYAKQHADGFICREIHTYSGDDLFEPEFPSATGPNILAWTEWLSYQSTGDTDRLCRVFPALVAYHMWYRDMRTHRGGGYWASGWASGMDNQTRVPHSSFHHRHYIWLDTCMQQALNCRMLLNIGETIGHSEFVETLSDEYETLTGLINDKLWDADTRFYYDLGPDDVHSTIKSIGAYWGLVAGIMPQERLDIMLGHLDDENMFNRPHRVPTQSADGQKNVDYYDDGHYWLGGVWAPTNYMVLRGLTDCGAHDLAYDIALSHVMHVAQVFEETETLWENYAPEYPSKGNPSRGDFVGWTGASAIAIPIEYLCGIQMDYQTGILKWTIRLQDERHGVMRYPLNRTASADLIYEPDTHVLDIRSDLAFSLEVQVKNRSLLVQVEKGRQTIGLAL